MNLFIYLLTSCSIIGVRLFPKIFVQHADIEQRIHHRVGYNTNFYAFQYNNKYTMITTITYQEQYYITLP